ncbi:hypothetical protein [Pseudomonas sp. MF6747]|uniref:hypothetical protein n=1 Tax=Pseudomonas sp. MF6747 TaxID=2797527 RepID=UPI001909ACC9|nr:hypothetical protein [Pseudomonas sp. MF6747]MBK3506624.1 hypothetical protein [Pseudomonas sp. MF6747]
MKKYFLYILILISCAISNVALSAQPSNSNQTQADAECGVTASGFVPPWSFCFAKEDRSAQLWAALNPAMFEVIQFKFITNVKDLIPDEKNRTSIDKDQILENATDREKTLSYIYFVLNEYIFKFGLYIFAAIFVILFIFKQMPGNLERTGKNGAVYTLHCAFLTGLLFIGLMPFYKDNGSIIQYYFNYSKVYGAAVANSFHRFTLASTQSNTVVTDTVDIEKRLEDISKNQNSNLFSSSFEYVNKMFAIEFCLLRSENVTYEKTNVIPERIAFNTYQKINGSEFTTGTNFSGRTDRGTGITYDCGSTQNDVSDIKSFSGEYADISNKVGYDSFLKRLAESTTLKSNDRVSEIWQQLEDKLLGELKVFDTSKLTTEQRNTMKFFNKNFFSYAIHAMLTNNKINGVAYNSSFLEIEERLKAVAVNVNAANCLSNDTLAMESISRATNYESKMCGFIDKSGAYQEIINQDSASYAVFIEKANNGLKEIISDVQKAKMSVEAQFAKTSLKYSHAEDYKQLSREGYSTFPLALNMTTKQGIFSDVEELRNNIKIYPQKNDSGLFVGAGNVEFQNLITFGYADSGDLNKAITDAFKDLTPTNANTKQALISTYQINSNIENDPFKDVMDSLGIESLSSIVKRNFGIPEHVSFTKQAYDSCGAVDSSADECPLVQANFMNGMTNSLASINRTATDIIALGLSLKLVSGGISIVNSLTGDKADKETNAGKISNKDTTNRNDSSKNKGANATQQIDKLANQASSLGDIFIAAGAGAVVYFSGVMNYIQFTPYYYFIAYDISYQFLTWFVTITVSAYSIIILLNQGPEAVFKFIVKTSIRIAVFPLLLMVFTAIAYYCLSLFMFYLFAIILSLDMIRDAGNQNLITGAILNWLFIGIAFLVGGVGFVRFIFNNVFIFFYEILALIGTKVEELTDSALVHLQVVSAMIMNKFIFAIENKGYFSERVWFNDMKKDVANHREKSVQRKIAKELRNNEKTEERRTKKANRENRKTNTDRNKPEE